MRLLLRCFSLMLAMLGPTLVLAAPPSGYRLAWSDEFNGTALDEAKWDYRTGVRYWSTQLPQNVSVSDGLLHLLLKKETVGATSYTAGGVISRDLFRYGFYEARMKVPPGRGWHTSFWMMRNNRPETATVATELDVIENDSITPTSYGVNTHRHLPTPHTTFGNKSVTTPSLNADFHVFGCEFTPTTIRYLFDGTVVQTVDATQFAHDDLNVWLTSIAASLGGTPSVDDTQLPSEAVYDWVRFYEPFAVPSVSITSPASPAVTLADASSSLELAAQVASPNGPSTVVWSMVEGPGTAAFSETTSLLTEVTFPTPGRYVLQCAATNEGGTAVDQVCVGVGVPTRMNLRQGVDGYAHTATIIRADNPDWNAGARDQLLAGRNTSAFRSVFSFPLTVLPNDATIQDAELDLTTVGGTGTVGALRLRALTATPVEGTGISDGSTGANLGTGTGATWTTRTGGSGAADLWAAPGGDFASALLAETPGFAASTPGLPVVFSGAPALLDAVRSAQAEARPLDLILSAANESSSTGYARIASDDEPQEALRPLMRITFTGNRLPSIGAAPLSGPAHALLNLGATTNEATGFAVMCVAGPGTPTVTDPANPSTDLTFPKPGSYSLRLTASNGLGETTRLVEATVAPDPAFFDDWRTVHWPDPLATGQDANDDPDHDGFANLLEWAFLRDPIRADSFVPQLQSESAGFRLTVLGRRFAPGEAALAAEWAEDVRGPWSQTGVVADDPVEAGPEGQTIVFHLPVAPGGKGFVRLRVTKP